MDDDVRALLGSQCGVFTAAEAGRRGIDADRVLAHVRRKQLVRVRRSAFVSGALWAAADQDERLRLRTLAIARTRPADVASHQSGLAIHRLPLRGSDAGVVHLDGPGKQIVHRDGLVLHPLVVDRGLGDGVKGQDASGRGGGPSGMSSESERYGAFRFVDGIRVVEPARAIVRSALTSGEQCAIVAADRALNQKRVSMDDLLREVSLISPHEGRGRAERAILKADGGAQSVLESLTRLVAVAFGFLVETQYRVHEADGILIGIADMRIDNVLLECDGRIKYLRQLVGPDGEQRPTSNEEIAQIVWEEKKREDRMRRRGFGFVRVIWDDLARPGQIAARIREAKC